MMEIKEATHEDLPEMIALLKISLGEGLIPKSEEYFIWKHEKNPFGKSKILLAREDGKIVGLRAFMHWKWATSSESISAVRAVDTATDPAYQGKGIFKKLTLQAVDECKQEGIDLVFNTPNNISIQGYLKMGWYTAGKMPIYLGPGSLAPRLFSDKILEKVYSNFNTKDAFSKFPENWSLPNAASEFHTPISTAYLKWRYIDCPIVNYGAIIEKGKFGIVFRLKKINRFIELRICEIWTEQENMDVPAFKALKKIVRFSRPALVTCSESPLFNTQKKRMPGLFGPFKRGPVTTLKPLAKDKLNNFDQFCHWKPSMGTMELF